MKYRKKPVEIEAIQLRQDTIVEIVDWLDGGGADYSVMALLPNEDEVHYLMIGTPEGAMRANLDDWIIRGVAGEFYPCKPDIFEATYEEVTE